MVEACAEAGAVSIGCAALHLRGPLRQHYFTGSRQVAPDLVRLHRARFGGGAYQPEAERARIERIVRETARACGVTGPRPVPDAAGSMRQHGPAGGDRRASGSTADRGRRGATAADLRRASGVPAGPDVAPTRASIDCRPTSQVNARGWQPQFAITLTWPSSQAPHGADISCVTPDGAEVTVQRGDGAPMGEVEWSRGKALAPSSVPGRRHECRPIEGSRPCASGDSSDGPDRYRPSPSTSSRLPRTVAIALSAFGPLQGAGAGPAPDPGVADVRRLQRAVGRCPLGRRYRCTTAATPRTIELDAVPDLDRAGRSSRRNSSVMGCVVGAAFVYAVVHRQRPLKLFFNVASTPPASPSAAVVFRELLGGQSPVSLHGWGALAAATLCKGAHRDHRCASRHEIGWADSPNSARAPSS